MSEMPSVLIVDDEDGFRSVLVRRLQTRGIQAFGIGRGEEALVQRSSGLGLAESNLSVQYYERMSAKTKRIICHKP